MTNIYELLANKYVTIGIVILVMLIAIIGGIFVFNILNEGVMANIQSVLEKNTFKEPIKSIKNITINEENEDYEQTEGITVVTEMTNLSFGETKQITGNKDNPYEKEFNFAELSKGVLDIQGKHILFYTVNKEDYGRQLFLYDIETQNIIEIKIATHESISSISAKTEGDNVIFTMNCNLYLFKISTKEIIQITDDKPTDYNPKREICPNMSPDIYKNQIVWNHNFNLWLADIDDIDNSKIQITTENNTKYNPRIFKNKIIWKDTVIKEPSIWVFDIETQEKKKVVTPLVNRTKHDFYENKIIWLEYNYSESDYTRISYYEYDLDTEKTTKVMSIDNKTFCGTTLPIFENYIAECRHAEKPLKPIPKIYIYDMQTNEHYLLDPYGSVPLMDKSEKDSFYIVWRSKENLFLKKATIKN